MSDTGILISLDDDDVINSRVVLDYTSRDFTSIRAQLVGLARGLMPEWETVGEPSDFGTLLLELFAYMGDVMNFYIDRSSSEAFLGTAIRRQSVLYIADMLGYIPIGQQAASVRLLFALDTNAFEHIVDLDERAAARIVLPAGTRFHNDAGDADELVVFTLDAPITLAAGDTDIEGYATEGIEVKDVLLGVGSGSPNAEWILINKGVVFGSISVRSAEGNQTVNWTYVSDLSLGRPTQPVFTTFIDDQETTHLIFGDNASGRIPPVGASMYVTYRFGQGARANLVPIGSIATVVPPANVDTWAVSVTNPAVPLGGTDPESVDSMRSSIPRAAARIKQRAVTLNDYADLALQVPGVAKSVSHGTVYTAVHVRIAPQDGQGNPEYMARLIEQVEAYMGDKIIIGSTVYAEPEDVDDLWNDVYIRFVLHVTDGYNRTSVLQQVTGVVSQVLAFNTVDFGTRTTIGQMYRSALAVAGVEWAELTWLHTAPPSNALEKTIDTDPVGRIVGNIQPDALHIPRINPTEIIETEVDFPDLEEEERTHTGLWIKAVGGMPGT